MTVCSTHFEHTDYDNMNFAVSANHPDLTSSSECYPNRNLLTYEF